MTAFRCPCQMVFLAAAGIDQRSKHFAFLLKHCAVCVQCCSSVPALNTDFAKSLRFSVCSCTKN